MRPPGPVPATCAISTPSSRANRRTDGAAGIDSANSTEPDATTGATATAAATATGLAVAMFTTGAGALTSELWTLDSGRVYCGARAGRRFLP